MAEETFFRAGGVTEAGDAWSVIAKRDVAGELAVYVGVKDLISTHPDGYCGLFSIAEAAGVGRAILLACEFAAKETPEYKERLELLRRSASPLMFSTPHPTPAGGA